MAKWFYNQGRLEGGLLAIPPPCLESGSGKRKSGNGLQDEEEEKETHVPLADAVILHVSHAEAESPASDRHLDSVYSKRLWISELTASVC